MALCADQRGSGFFVFLLRSVAATQPLYFKGAQPPSPILEGATKIDTTKPTTNIILLQHDPCLAAPAVGGFSFVCPDGDMSWNHI